MINEYLKFFKYVVKDENHIFNPLRNIHSNYEVGDKHISLFVDSVNETLIMFCEKTKCEFIFKLDELSSLAFALVHSYIYNKIALNDLKKEPERKKCIFAGYGISEGTINWNLDSIKEEIIVKSTNDEKNIIILDWSSLLSLASEILNIYNIIWGNYKYNNPYKKKEGFSFTLAINSMIKGAAVKRLRWDMDSVISINPEAEPPYTLAFNEEGLTFFGKLNNTAFLDKKGNYFHPTANDIEAKDWIIVLDEEQQFSFFNDNIKIDADTEQFFGAYCKTLKGKVLHSTKNKSTYCNNAKCLICNNMLQKLNN